MEKHDEFKKDVESRIRKNRLLKRAVQVLLVLAVLFFIVSLIYAGFVSIKNTDTYTLEDNQKQTPQEQGLIDSDGDGLFDWQEELYGTSKKLRDSDGDGKSDGEEIAAGEDPNYYGEGIISVEVDPQREIYPEFNYSVPEVTEREPITSSLSGDVVAGSVQDDEVRVTINELALAVQDSYITQEGSVDIFKNLFLQKEVDKDYFTQIIGRYKNSAGRISQLSEPALQTEINSLAISYRSIADTLDALTKDLPTYQENHAFLLVQYGQSVESLQKSIISINAFVRAKGISFKASDPGIYFQFNL